MGLQYIRGQLALLIRMALAIGSLIIYAVATLVLNQPRYVQYDSERTSLAAAVSNAAYGAPIGTIYTGVLSRLLDSSRPMQQTFEETARGEVQAGSLLKVAMDGNGIGYLLFATLALRLFGLHLSSMTFALVTLMAISTLAFLLRYQDNRVLIIPLYFLSLTVMLFTILVSDPGIAGQIPIGGIRYFSLLGILPAIHILLELFDRSKFSSKRAFENFVLLGVQLLVLAVAIVVRSSAAYLLGAIVVGFFIAVRVHRDDRAGLRNTLGKGALTAILGALFVVLFVLWIPSSYKESGRAMGNFWHRVLISLGAHPAWPFAKLREIYHCEKYIPEGLVPGLIDTNGYCVWLAYGLDHGLSTSEINNGVYGGRYETAMKAAFFNIARLYPVEVLETFAYYKPMRFLLTIRQLIKVDFIGKPFAMISLLLAQALNTIIFVICDAPDSSRNRMRSLLAAVGLFSVFALLPMLVAWSIPHTSADPLFYFFFGLGLVLAAAIDGICNFSRRSNPRFAKPARPE